MTPTHIDTTRVNADKGWTIYHEVEPIKGTIFEDDEPGELAGNVYRFCVREYGRCTGSVYIDTEDGVKRIGWCFLKREHYEDTGEPFLVETWVNLATMVEPARPMQLAAVAI